MGLLELLNELVAVDVIGGKAVLGSDHAKGPAGDSKGKLNGLIELLLVIFGVLTNPSKFYESICGGCI